MKEEAIYEGLNKNGKFAFVNFLSTLTPNALFRNFKKQHNLFVTSVKYGQPGGINGLILGKREDMFVEGLEKLKKYKSKFNMPVLYLDNDCVLMNRIDDLFQYDFDVGVVYRYEKNENGGRQDCLGGFLFFSQKRKDREDYFLDMLIDTTKKWYLKEKSNGDKPWWYDQLAINELIGEPLIKRKEIDYALAKDYLPNLKVIDGIRVLYLSANVWACPMADHLPSKVKIFHYNHKMTTLIVDKDAFKRSQRENV